MSSNYTNQWKRDSYRSLWQHEIWGEFQQSVGRKSCRLTSEGASALLIKHSLSKGFNWIEVPRGPLYKDDKNLADILSKIKSVGKKEKSIFIRFSSYKKCQALDVKCETSPFDHHPENSLVIDLELSEPALLAQMKPKGRYNIKVAQKHGVVVKESKDVNAFYKILSKTGGRDGFGIHAKNYYQKMLDKLGSHAQLLLAHYEDKVIAGGIFVYLDEWGIYYYGASDHSYRKQMAPYLVQWAAIKEAKKRGCKHYDFLGISPENANSHVWAGVTQFKKKFGGRTVEYPQAKDLVLRPFWYRLYGWYKKLRG